MTITEGRTTGCELKKSQMSQELKTASRVVPVQDRAQQRLSEILDAAQALLQADEKVTTSSIAERAQIPVGSVYRYFPNLDAVYLHLFIRLSSELRERIEQVISEQDAAIHWQELHRRSLEQSLGFISENMAYGKLKFAMPTPSIGLVEKEAAAFLAGILAARWEAGYDGFHGGDVHKVAQVAARLFTFVEQCHYESCASDNSKPSLVDEAIEALRAYLSLYLGD